MSLLPPIPAIFDLFKEAGLATVTRPGVAPVDVDYVWLPARSTQEPIGSGTVLDTMLRLAFRVDQVGELPIGSRVSCPPLGSETPRIWTVRRIDAVDAERVIAGVL